MSSAGADNIKKYWSRYYQGSQGVVFVLDSASSDEDLEAARNELHSALQHPQLCTLPFLILANHQDKPAARTPNQVPSRHTPPLSSLHPSKDQNNNKNNNNNDINNNNDNNTKVLSIGKQYFQNAPHIFIFLFFIFDFTNENHNFSDPFISLSIYCNRISGDTLQTCYTGSRAVAIFPQIWQFLP